MKKDNRYFIFCDFDGVLSKWTDWFAVSYYQESGNIKTISNKTIQAIDNFCKKPVYFVPTSIWSYIFKNKGSLTNWLNEMNCKFLKEFDEPIIDERENKKLYESKFKDISVEDIRAFLINEFIKKYNIKKKNYICLDDETYLSYKKFNLNIIKTDMYEGITYKQFHKLIKVLEKWSKKD